MDDYRDDRGRFAPGNPGGPGRPKNEDSITAKLRELAEEVDGDSGKTKAHQIAEKMIELALLDGDRTMLQYVTDRLGGKPTQTNVNQNYEMPEVVGYYPDDFETDS